MVFQVLLIDMRHVLRTYEVQQTWGNFFICDLLPCRNLTRTISSTRRVAMYITPVMIVSVCLNIPKFMETQATHTDNSTKIGVTDMRLNPTYMLYYTISQIFHPTLTTGIIPMVALIFMNTSIFFGEPRMPYKLHKLFHDGRFQGHLGRFTKNP